VSNRLLVSLKTLIACGKVFKIDVRSSYKLFPKVFVNVGCQYSSFGKYPVVSGAGFVVADVRVDGQGKGALSKYETINTSFQTSGQTTPSM